MDTPQNSRTTDLESGGIFLSLQINQQARLWCSKTFQKLLSSIINPVNQNLTGTRCCQLFQLWSSLQIHQEAGAVVAEEALLYQIC